MECGLFICVMAYVVYNSSLHSYDYTSLYVAYINYKANDVKVNIDSNETKTNRGAS